MKTTQQKKIVLLFVLFLVTAGAALYWWHGSGQMARGIPVQTNLFGHLNMEVPDAKVKSRDGWTKLDYYKQADADSARLRSERARDPFHQTPAISASEEKAAQVNRQLQSLERQLRAPAKMSSQKISSTQMRTGATADVKQLEALMENIRRKPVQRDPELQELNQLLDKMIDVQHPASQQSSPEKNARHYTVYQPHLSPGSGFFSLADSSLQNHPAENSFSAVVSDEQTLVNGAVIQLRLSEAIAINGQTIPADQAVYGTVNLNKERLLIDISHIRIGKLLLPVKLCVFDTDGLPGIYVPGAITREVARQSAGRSASSLNLLSPEASVGAQVAGAGVQAARTLLQRKVQQVCVTIPAGYAVLLKNN